MVLTWTINVVLINFSLIIYLNDMIESLQSFYLSLDYIYFIFKSNVKFVIY